MCYAVLLESLVHNTPHRACSDGYKQCQTRPAEAALCCQCERGQHNVPSVAQGGLAASFWPYKKGEKSAAADKETAETEDTKE